MYQQQSSDDTMYYEGSPEYEKLQSKICLECGTQISMSFNNSNNLPTYKCPSCGKYYYRHEKSGRLFWQA